MIRSCENYYVAMPSSSDLGATKTASMKIKSIIQYIIQSIIQALCIEHIL